MSRRYAFVRAAARFATVRRAVVGVTAVVTSGRNERFFALQRAQMSSSRFADIDVDATVAAIRRDGWCDGLQLPTADVAAVAAFAERSTVYADRDPALGFPATARAAADAALGKPVLVAQYFNAQRHCPTIDELANDPALALIAGRFLGTVPKLVGTSLWWTYPVDALAEDRDRHAHLFHRDVDDFAFLKFFFYLTPVAAGDGAHVCVTGSHIDPPYASFADWLWLRRYRDDEIERRYAPERIREITGPAGSGFAENTLCVHKGLTPTRSARLLLQFEFALSDHGIMHDRRGDDELRMLPLAGVPA